MRTKFLPVTIIVGALLIVLYALWAGLLIVPIASGTCEDGDNVCLFHQMVDVSNANMEKTGSDWDAGVQEMFDL